MSELWKSVPGYEGLYEVSDLGRVKSLDRQHLYKGTKTRKVKGKFLKLRKDYQGRRYVNLHKNKKTERYFVHKLVALVFIGKRPEGYDICHNNGDKQDNRLSNLRYDTKKQNQIDIYRQGGKHGLGKLDIEDVVNIRRLYSTGEYTYKYLGDIYSVSKSTIGSIIRNESFYWIDDSGCIESSNTKVS